MKNFIIFSGCKIPKEMLEKLQKSNFSKEYMMDEFLINSPLPFDEEGEAKDFIRIVGGEMDIILLVDIHTKNIYLYKGECLNRIKKVYLPKFCLAYSLEIPAMSIVDLRVPEQLFETANALALAN